MNPTIDVSDTRDLAEGRAQHQLWRTFTHVGLWAYNQTSFRVQLRPRHRRPADAMFTTTNFPKRRARTSLMPGRCMQC
jgi:hypothetical protein